VNIPPTNEMHLSTPRPRWAILALLTILGLTTGCVQPWPDSEPWRPSQTADIPAAFSTPNPSPTGSSAQRPTRDPSLPILSPTPDAPHTLPTLRSDVEIYTVQSGDSLGALAQRYGVSLSALIQTNSLENPDLLEIGTRLTIPAQESLAPGPALKLIPDSELVNSPGAVDFDTNAFVSQAGGYLANYHDEVNELSLSGAEVVARVAQEYSVNSRLLLSILEYQSGWVTQAHPDDEDTDYPLGYLNNSYKGLYLQLSWAANNLNRGYYLWKIGGLSLYLLADGAAVPPAETLNAGTVAVQQFFSLLYDQASWEQAVSESGWLATYQRLFGYPFDAAIEPLLPVNLAQPALQLPFEPGVDWSFTGGPHGGWGAGSAWAALDFAPPGDAFGCVPSNAWVVASADGLIVRSQDGAVVQDLDGDGNEQTGWTLLYMHVQSEGRVSTGIYLHAGERLGHPSCEGGVSNGTHVHLARRYNGEWIAADQSIPFVLDGWVSSGNGVEYDGWLTKDGQTIEAWNGREPENQIHR
jgi:LasA protease